ncbi:ABC transporter substrate-binding protein [Cellulomonas denverensis]|uniref:ABC transporter substrate-binding protein n=1 Tax=Cellulomonas denverensis TaxID=264297 RepID=UPI0035EEE3F5
MRGPGHPLPTPTPVTLVYAASSPGAEQAVIAWNAVHPDIQVEYRPEADPADLVQVDLHALPTLVDDGTLTDLTGLIDYDLPLRYADGTWQAVTLGGTATYAVPQDTHPLVLAYRPEVLAGLGLPVPSTWQEYADLGRDLHAADPGLLLAGLPADDPAWFAGLTAQAGARSWDDEPARRVAGYWGDLVAAGVVGPDPGDPAAVTAITDRPPAGWAIAPLPRWTPGDPVGANRGGSATAITTASAHREQAARFLVWMNANPEGATLLVAEDGIVPADLDLLPELIADRPGAEVLTAEAAAVPEYRALPTTDRTDTALRELITAALDTGTAQAFLDAVATLSSLEQP